MSKIVAIAILSSMIALHANHFAKAEGAFALGRGANTAFWWGTAVNRQTLAEARAAALQLCLSKGPNCTILSTFRMGCFALAAPTNGPGFTWVTRRTQSEAEQFVMSDCLRHGRPCQMKGSTCDSIDEAAVAAQRREQAEQQDAQRRESARQEVLQRERGRQETERREWDRREAERREADRREWERTEAARRFAASGNTAFTPTTAVGLVIGILLAAIGAIAKTELPVFAKILIAIATPVASIVLQHLLGIEIKDGITLYQFALLNLPGGGILAAALVYKAVA